MTFFDIDATNLNKLISKIYLLQQSGYDLGYKIEVINGNLICKKLNKTLTPIVNKNFISVINKINDIVDDNFYQYIIMELTDHNIEIEKKYLVKETPELSKIKYKTIEQFYISYNPEIRIRKSNEKYFITQKGEGNLIRTEQEKLITREVYDKYQKSKISNKIIKKRYEIALSPNYIAELDIYGDYLTGLSTVEIEFSKLQDLVYFEKPSWFGDDITNNQNYKNKNLAKQEIKTKKYIKEVTYD